MLGEARCVVFKSNTCTLIGHTVPLLQRHPRGLVAVIKIYISNFIILPKFILYEYIIRNNSMLIAWSQPEPPTEISSPLAHCRVTILCYRISQCIRRTFSKNLVSYIVVVDFFYLHFRFLRLFQNQVSFIHGENTVIFLVLQIELCDYNRIING